MFHWPRARAVYQKYNNQEVPRGGHPRQDSAVWSRLTTSSQKLCILPIPLGLKMDLLNSSQNLPTSASVWEGSSAVRFVVL